jgi:uncharacterized protein
VVFFKITARYGDGLVKVESEWDEEKAARNFLERGLHFADAAGFNWATAQTFADERTAYGEERFMSRGMIGERLHILVFVLREDKLRIISFRKANRREQNAYASETGRPIREVR